MAALVSHHFPSIYKGYRKSLHKVNNNMLNIEMLVTSLLKCLQCFSMPAEQALYLYPCLTFPWSSLCLSLSDLDSYHSLSHSQCPDIFRYSKPSRQGDCTSFPSRGMSHPVLLSSKHLYLLPIYAKYLFFSPFLEPHCSFLHLRCAQEVDLWGWHQWVLVQLETSEGEGECLPPCKHTGAGTSLTAPPKVINSAGCSLPLWEKLSSY